MLIVALTGGIATGKSVVARILKEKGCFIQDADRIAHQLTAPGGEIWSDLVAHFGKEILKDDQTIDRKKLGTIIFHNPEEREFLNRLTHPRILEKIRETIAHLEKSGGYEIYITEAALVIEAGYHTYYDRIILTYCRPDQQLERIRRRYGLSREKALERIQAQLPTEKKIPYAHYLIDTSGSMAETIDQAERVYFNLYQEAILKKMGQLCKE